MDLKAELEKYAFPSELDDQDIVEILKLEQPLDSITLKAPQLLVHYYGLCHKRFVLSFDKGMGKTIAYLSILYKSQQAEKRKVIIICPENAKSAQRREIQRHLHKWFDKWTFVKGTRDQRRKAWNSDNEVYICTYDSLLADMGERTKSSKRICPEWVTSADMAFDEWHKKLRTYKSGMFKMLKKHFTTGRMIFSSGSAGGKGVHSMWPILHLCDPLKFKAYWPYVQKWSHVEETYFGKKYYGCTNISSWRRFVATAVFHRRKDLKDYPLKTRQALEIEMESWQKKIHDSLLQESYAELSSEDLFVAPNKLASLMKLRQFMICPKVLDPNLGYGVGLEGIWDDFETSELTHFVLSVPFKTPIPFIEEFFRSKGINTERLMGGDGCDADEIDRRIARWTKLGGVMIQTIQFAESYELPAARIMYFLGYLHDPEQNSQAEDRIVRDIRVTPHPVDIYYVKHLRAYDEKILEAMSDNADNLHFLMNMPIKEFIDNDG